MDAKDAAEVKPEAGDHEDDGAVDDGEGGHDGHADKPEPQEHIDFLVDDIQSKDTEAVVLCNRSGGAVLLECALGHLD